MITKEAILHIPLSQYAFANDEFNMTIRIRVGRNNVERIVLWYGDRVQPSNPIIFTPIEMCKIMSAGAFDYYEVTFDTPYDRVCYYFELFAGADHVYHYADLTENYLPEERSEFYQYPFIRREELGWEPEWFKEAIVYNIFPDSFATEKSRIENCAKEIPWKNGLSLKSRLGGTIRGIYENLDYIQGLGFNCVYLNPIFTAAEYHKYDLLDYYHVSPNLGTDEEFRTLVDEIHHRGMHIVIDGVFNHCSWYFPQFDDVVKKGEDSRYKDWFYRLEYPVIRPESETEKPTYSCFAYERKMPKLNSSNKEEREYFMRVCRYWLEEFHVDGWRLDVANELDRDFWREFKRVAREVNPDSVMIGEIWESSETWLNGDMFDSTMNYDFRKICRDFFGQSRIDAEQFHDRVAKMLLRYRTQTLRVQLNLLDSHDVNRFMSYCHGDKARMRLAEVFMFTSPGIPCVFYGDELGMDGNTEYTLRGPMPWEKQNSEHTDFFRQLISLRKSNPVLLNGNYRLIELTKQGAYIFSRADQGTEIVVCLNNSDEALDISEHLHSGELLMQERCNDWILESRGYAIIRKGD